MRVYLDTSALVPILTDDGLTPRADSLERFEDASFLVSDFVAAEFASVLSRRVRMGELTPADAAATFVRFDGWLAAIERIETFSIDIRAAEAMMRRLDLSLRTPDALNIALARRAEAALATFDRQMAGAARALGIDVID